MIYRVRNSIRLFDGLGNCYSNNYMWLDEDTLGVVVAEHDGEIVVLTQKGVVGVVPYALEKATTKYLDLVPA